LSKISYTSLVKILFLLKGQKKHQVFYLQKRE